MDKLNLYSPDFTKANIEKLAELFPNCVTETRAADGTLKKAIDFDLLKQELSTSIVEGPQERYQLNWPGKREALLTANAPIAKTLRPCRVESVDFDTTQNLYIEGDNLDALKLLQETYLGKVKMIYIDPPYNTGSDFIYHDEFNIEKNLFDIQSGVKDEEGYRLIDQDPLSQNSESNGRFHSDWLNMMYPRLKLARNLLKDDGVIAVHIDENEYTNLEKLLSEIFGDSNNIGTIVWDKRNPKGAVAGVAQQHELISFYSKNKCAFAEGSYFSRKKENANAMLNKVQTLVKSKGEVNDEVRTLYRKWLNERKNDLSGGELAYNMIDKNGDIYRPVSMAAPDKPETRSHRPLIHPITLKPCPVPAKGWRFPDKTMDVLLIKGDVLFGIDESTQPQRKYLLRENLRENVPSLFYFGGSDDALSLPFDNPKPVSMATKIIEPICKPNDIILDFFSGSATTAHALMQLNAEDGGNRKFIMVQLPEVCALKSQAYKAGYKTIAEIGKERIRRAGRKIKDELGRMKDEKGGENSSLSLDPSSLDIGFRVLKVDSSNMKDVYYTPDKLKQGDLDQFTDNIRDDSTPEDLLFQVLLDWGVDLTLPITQETIAGFTVLFVDDNALAACFDADITEAFVKELAARHPMRVVFRDAGFASDSVKINIEQIFKLISPATEIKTL